MVRCGPAGSGLAAVGTRDGFVQLVDARTLTVKTELAVHACPIKCLEWGGPDRLVTAAYSHTLTTAQIVRNEVVATDIRTGK